MSRPSLVSIGCGAGFSGDRVDAPVAVVDHLARLDRPSALMFETLGERTLALAQQARLADPINGGYEPLLVPLLEPVLGRCLDAGIRIVGNFGAANPLGAARRLKLLAREIGAREPRIAVVTGDDLTDRFSDLPAEIWEGERENLTLDPKGIIAANAYLGFEGIRQGLDAGADIIVTGRVADPSLALGPLAHFFDWPHDDWDLMAAGLLAGHLIECGSQVTGGYFADPGRKDVSGMAELGYPIADVSVDGRVEITKPPGTGGLVDARTVKEQLLYEIHDPSTYITPDGVMDLSDVEVAEVGPDRVRVSGVRGRPATSTYKVMVSLRGGWLGEGEISYAGPNAEARARLTGEVLRERLRRRRLALRTRIDLIGVVSVLDDDGGTLAAGRLGSAEDVRVRLAVEAERREDAEAATQEVLALLCTGPAGGGGARRRHVERIHTVSYLVPKSSVPMRLEML